MVRADSLLSLQTNLESRGASESTTHPRDDAEDREPKESTRRSGHSCRVLPSEPGDRRGGHRLGPGLCRQYARRCRLAGRTSRLAAPAPAVDLESSRPTPSES